MLNFIRKKLGFTPFWWDVQNAVLSVTVACVALYLWPVALTPLYLTLFASLVLADVAMYFLEPNKEQRKHLPSTFFDIGTYNASRKLLDKASTNQLTTFEAEWLLSPGFFRDKADVSGGLKLKNEITVLHWLAHHGRKDLLEFLINQHGVSTQFETYIGTPFTVAVSRNHPQLLELLFFSENQLENRKCHGFSPREYSARKGLVEVLKVLNKLKPMTTEAEKFAVLTHALGADQISVLKWYHEEFKDTFALKEKGSNLIHVATRVHAQKCMGYLLENASSDDYNLQGENGFTPADEAYIFDSPCYKILLEKGAKRSDRDLDQTRVKRREFLNSFALASDLKPFAIELRSHLCGEPEEDYQARNARAAFP